MKILIIANRIAGSVGAASSAAAIEDAARERGLEATIEFPGSAVEATRTVARADLQPYDAVVAAGGDGTLFRVLNGLLSNPVARPIGIIPLGTGNAFAKDLGLLGGDIRSAMKIIARGRTAKTDIGQVQCPDQAFYFLNIIGLGFVVDAGVTAARLKFVGSASYSLAAAWNILGLRSHKLEFSLDGEAFSTDTILLELSNSRYTGTNFLIAPGASIDDGLLDMTLLKQLSRTRLIRLFPTIYRGDHVRFEEVRTAKVKNIELLSPSNMPLMADGELIGHTPATIRCLPGAVSLLR